MSLADNPGREERSVEPVTEKWIMCVNRNISKPVSAVGFAAARLLLVYCGPLLAQQASLGQGMRNDPPDQAATPSCSTPGQQPGSDTGRQGGQSPIRRNHPLTSCCATKRITATSKIPAVAPSAGTLSSTSPFGVVTTTTSPSAARCANATSSTTTRTARSLQTRTTMATCSNATCCTATCTWVPTSASSGNSRPGWRMTASEDRAGHRPERL